MVWTSSVLAACSPPLFPLGLLTQESPRKCSGGGEGWGMRWVLF